MLGSGIALKPTLPAGTDDAHTPGHTCCPALGKQSFPRQAVPTTKLQTHTNATQQTMPWGSSTSVQFLPEIKVEVFFFNLGLESLGSSRSEDCNLQRVTLLAKECFIPGIICIPI